MGFNAKAIIKPLTAKILKVEGFGVVNSVNTPSIGKSGRAIAEIRMLIIIRANSQIDRDKYFTIFNLLLRLSAIKTNDNAVEQNRKAII